jgi:hypothetical protein
MLAVTIRNLPSFDRDEVNGFVHQKNDRTTTIAIYCRLLWQYYMKYEASTFCHHSINELRLNDNSKK